MPFYSLGDILPNAVVGPEKRLFRTRLQPEHENNTSLHNLPSAQYNESARKPIQLTAIPCTVVSPLMKGPSGVGEPAASLNLPSDPTFSTWMALEMAGIENGSSRWLTTYRNCSEWSSANEDGPPVLSTM